MSEQKKEEGKECCSTEKSSCGCYCGVKKVIISILLALVLIGLGYCLGKGGYCPMKTCPVSQMMQK